MFQLDIPKKKQKTWDSTDFSYLNFNDKREKNVYMVTDVYWKKKQKVLMMKKREYTA